MYWVYILCSNRNGTLYIGITNNILRRTYEYKQKIIKGFTTKYNVIKLVYTEEFTDIKEALVREKTLKKWNRSWKIKLIEKFNPEWEDLGKDFSGFPLSCYISSDCIKYKKYKSGVECGIEYVRSKEWYGNSTT